MIHRNGYNGPITFECDSCEEVIDTNEVDFHEALLIAKEQGWKVTKIDNNWFHLCSFDCQKQASRENRPKLPEVHNMKRPDAMKWLGLPDAATKDDVKSAYRRLIQVCHPDKGGTTALGQLLNEAYEILK